MRLHPVETRPFKLVRFGVVFSHDVIAQLEKGLPLVLSFAQEGMGWEIGGMAVVNGAKAARPELLQVKLIDYDFEYAGKNKKAFIDKFTNVIAAILLFGRNGLVTRRLLADGIGVDVYHLGFDLFGMIGLVFVQTITFFSVAYLILRGILERLDPALEEAGENWGASRWRIFRAVTLPLLIPGMAGSFLLLYVESLTGHIILDGRLLDDVPPNRRDMAMVFQSYAIFPHLNVFENIAYGLKVKKFSASEIRRRVAETLSLTDLTGLEQRAPSQLSGGQQQRVALARALVMEPKVLLFDEPLANLDAKLREQMRAEIRRLQQTLGITSVYVTHDQAEAMTLSDRIVVMNQGRIVQIGTAQQLYRRPANAFVADFIGKANFLSALVVGVAPGHLDLMVLGRSLSIRPSDQALRVGECATLLARLEAVRLHVGEEGYPARVSRAAYLGPTVEYEVRVAEEVLILTQYDPDEVYPVGAEVHVQLVEEALYLLPRS